MSMCALTAVVVSQFFVADLSFSAITCAYACDDGPVPLSVRILIPSSKRCPPGYPAQKQSSSHPPPSFVLGGVESRKSIITTGLSALLA